MKKVLVIVILLVIGVIAYVFLSGDSDGVERDGLAGVLDTVKETVSDVLPSGFDDLVNRIDPSNVSIASQASKPRYTTNEAGEKDWTPSEWLGNTFYSYRGDFSITIPDNWVQMTKGQYNQLFDRAQSTMYFGTVNDANKPHTRIGMARSNLRSALTKIENTHDRVMAQFNNDGEIGGTNIPTFLTPIELGGTTWYYFKSGKGNSTKYYFGTCIEEQMYIMWIYHDDAYPVENITAMFGTLDKKGAHLSPNHDRTKAPEPIAVVVPPQLPTDMPLRILGMAPVHIPIDFQAEIRQGIKPDELKIPERASFDTHMALQVNGYWIWDLTANNVEILEVAPFIQDGRTMVPVRIIAEILGAEVGWHGATQTVTITVPGAERPAQDSEEDEEDDRQNYRRTVSLVLDVLDPAFLEYGLDVPATRVGSTTFVPLRFVSEFLGAEVHWIGSPYRQIDIIK